MIKETEAQRAEATSLKTAEPGPKPLAALKVQVVNSTLAPGIVLGLSSLILCPLTQESGGWR